jgi:hypothetical protein
MTDTLLVAIKNKNVYFALLEIREAVVVGSSLLI